VECTRGVLDRTCVADRRFSTSTGCMHAHTAFTLSRQISQLVQP